MSVGEAITNVLEGHLGSVKVEQERRIRISLTLCYESPLNNGFLNIYNLNISIGKIFNSIHTYATRLRCDYRQHLNEKGFLKHVKNTEVSFRIQPRMLILGEPLNLK